MQPQDALAWQLQQGVAIGVAIFPIVSFFVFTVLVQGTGRNSPKSDSEHSRSPSMRGPSIAWAQGPKLLAAATHRGGGQGETARKARRRELLRCALAPPLLAHRGRRWRSGRGSRAEWAR